MSERDANVANTVAAEDGSGVRTGIDTGSAILVAVDGEVSGFESTESEVAREKLATGFFGGEAGGQAGDATGAVAGVLELTLGEQAFEFRGSHRVKHPLEAGDLDGIETATVALRIVHIHLRFMK